MILVKHFWLYSPILPKSYKTLITQHKAFIGLYWPTKPTLWTSTTTTLLEINVVKHKVQLHYTRRRHSRQQDVHIGGPIVFLRYTIHIIKEAAKSDFQTN